MNSPSSHILTEPLGREWRYRSPDMRPIWALLPARCPREPRKTRCEAPAA